MNKKLLLTSAFAVAIAVPAMADTPTVNIAANVTEPDCTDSVLETTTGPVSLQADWTANTINLNWYDDPDSNTPISVTNSAAGTCTYDGTITLPTNTISKNGYTFAGWQVRPASGSGNRVTQSCFVDVDKSINKMSYGYVEQDRSSNAEKYGLTQLGEWAIEFSYGTVRGIGECYNVNPLEGERFATILASMEAGTITEGEISAAFYGPNGILIRSSNAFTSNDVGGVCWCRATSYTPNNGSICSVDSTLWVYNGDYGSVSNCAASCAASCGSADSTDYRDALFGIQ